MAEDSGAMGSLLKPPRVLLCDRELPPMQAGHRAMMPRGRFCWEKFNSPVSLQLVVLILPCLNKAFSAWQDQSTALALSVAIRPRNFTHPSQNSHVFRCRPSCLTKRWASALTLYAPAVAQLYLKLQELEEKLWSCSEWFSLFQL